MSTVTARGTARKRLLDVALDLIRTKGFTATTVDELCGGAGVTKGAFFHHFQTKEALGVAAAEHWSVTTGQLFARADYHTLADAAARVLGYVDLRTQMITGPPEEYSCVVGTMAQEIFDTYPAIREACGESILGHASMLEADIAAALEAAGTDDHLDAASLARYTQVVLQGAFVVSKAAHDSTVVTDALSHLRRYLEGILAPTPEEVPI